MIDDKQCNHCYYYEKISGEGKCKRYPPVIIKEAPNIINRDTTKLYDFDVHFPSVAFHDWCGEYQPAPRKLDD